ATCVVAAVVALAIWEPPRRKALPELAGETREHYWRGIASAFGDVWRSTDLRAVILLTGGAYAALESIGYLVQPYLVDRGIEVGVLFSLLQVPTILAGVVGSLLAARFYIRAGAAK